MNAEEDPLLTTSEVAEILRLKPNTLAVWRMDHAGPDWVEIGRTIRYRRSAVDTYLDRQTRKGSE